MATLQPLPPRAGQPARGELREDVPDALHAAGEAWLRTYLFDSKEAKEWTRNVAIVLDIEPSGARGGLYNDIIWHSRQGADEFFNVLHATLDVIRTTKYVVRYPPHENLEQSLLYANSVWSATENGLRKRVDETAQAAYEQARTIGGEASDELAQAWEQAYARNGNPAYAWSHAITAVEAALRPVVYSDNRKATLSNIIRDLRNQSFKLELRGRNRDHSVGPLINLLELIWTNPNRHGGSGEPPATAEEARAVVNLAVAIVQWRRDGQIVRK